MRVWLLGVLGLAWVGGLSGSGADWIESERWGGRSVGWGSGQLVARVAGAGAENSIGRASWGLRPQKLDHSGLRGGVGSCKGFKPEAPTLKAHRAGNVAFVAGHRSSLPVDRSSSPLGAAAGCVCEHVVRGWRALAPPATLPLSWGAGWSGSAMSNSAKARLHVGFRLLARNDRSDDADNRQSRRQGSAVTEIWNGTEAGVSIWAEEIARQNGGAESDWEKWGEELEGSEDPLSLISGSIDEAAGVRMEEKKRSSFRRKKGNRDSSSSEEDGFLPPKVLETMESVQKAQDRTFGLPADVLQESSIRQSRRYQGETAAGSGQPSANGAASSQTTADSPPGLGTEQNKEQQSASGDRSNGMSEAEGSFARDLFALREEEGQILASSLRQELQLTLEDLGANKPMAIVVSERLNGTHFGKEWKLVLSDLRHSLKIQGDALAEMLARYDNLLGVSQEHLAQLNSYMQVDLGFSKRTTRYILSKRPSLISVALDGPDSIQSTVAVLLSLGITKKQLEVAASKNPGILSIPAIRILDFVESINEGFQQVDGEQSRGQMQLASVVRSSPWILLYDTETQVKPVLRCLLGFEWLDVMKVIRSYPDVFSLEMRDQIYRICNLLLEIGLTGQMVNQIIETYPAILGIGVDSQILAVIDFLEIELGLSEEELVKIVRGFPSLLAADVEKELQPRVQFLKDVGITNIGRIVSLAPSIFAMDIQTELVPKMRFLDKVGLSSFDLARFPTYFTYPLDSIIRPRLLFFAYLGFPLTSKPLQWILAPTDEDFCEKTLGGVHLKQYRDFKETLPPIQLPPTRRKRTFNPGSPAVTCDVSKMVYEVKADTRFEGFNRRYSELNRVYGVIPKQGRGKEVWDAKKDDWIWEGKGESPISRILDRQRRRNLKQDVQKEEEKSEDRPNDQNRPVPPEGRESASEPGGDDVQLW